MAKSLNKNLDVLYDDIFFGNIKIYVNRRQQAKAEALILNMPNILTKGYDEGARKFANKLLRVVKKCLRTGTPPKGVSWPPHTAYTVRTLGAHTLMNWTGQYYRSVGIYTIGKRHPRMIVGLPSQVRKIRKSGRTSRRTLNQVAKMLEYGSASGELPPRPLWNPAYKEVGGDMALQKDIIRAVQKEIRKKI